MKVHILHYVGEDSCNGMLMSLIWFLVFGHVDFVFGFNWNLKLKPREKKNQNLEE